MCLQTTYLDLPAALGGLSLGGPRRAEAGRSARAGNPWGSDT